MQASDQLIQTIRPMNIFNPVSDNHELLVVEMETKQLLTELTSADFEKTRIILQRLKMLTAKVMPVGESTRRTSHIVEEAIARAKHQLDELDAEDARRHNTLSAQERFELSVYAAMSVQAQQFYNEIDTTATYTVAPVVTGGKVETAQAKVVEGTKLRRFFSLIKYHSLGQEQKKDILRSTFGTDDKEDDDKPKDKAALEAAKEEMKQLHEALRDMEAYKAFMVMSKSGGDLNKALRQIHENHLIFLAAHHQIDDVLHKYDLLIKNPDDKVAMAALKFARQKLKKILKDDVIDKVLLELTANPLAISGGINVADEQAGPVNLFGVHRSSFRLFGNA